eukprot:6709677-Prymnesium_polylepis.1
MVKPRRAFGACALDTLRRHFTAIPGNGKGLRGNQHEGSAPHPEPSAYTARGCKRDFQGRYRAN